MLGIVGILMGSAALSALISGTSDDDSITGTDQDDSINGRGGDDTLLGAGGNDNINGASGNDMIVGDLWDPADGEGGDDRLWGANGDDVLLGQGGDDQLYGGRGIDLLDGGAGDDDLRAGAGNDEVKGGDGDDLLFGQTGDDELVGGDGDDSLYGQNGNDRLIGGEGADRLAGGAGDDLLVDSDGNGTLYGQAGSDILISLGDTDGNDLRGGADDDLMIFEGDGIATGGAGADGFGLANGGGQELTIRDFDPENDALVVFYPEAADPSSLLYSVEDVPGNSLVVTVSMTGMDDMTVTLKNVQSDEVANGIDFSLHPDSIVDDLVPDRDGDNEPPTGPNTITGTSAADTITGTTADDVIVAGDAGDLVNAGDGNDFITSGSDVMDDLRQDVELQSQFGQSFYTVTNDGVERVDPDVVFGEAGDDVIVGSGHDLDAYGGAGADLLVSGTDGISQLRGDAGDDILITRGGDTAVDVRTVVRVQVPYDVERSEIYGGDGDDTLIVGENTYAYGGDGSNTYVALEGETNDRSIIWNFDAASDNLVLAYDDAAGPAPLASDISFTRVDGFSYPGFNPTTIPFDVLRISVAGGSTINLALPDNLPSGLESSYNWDVAQDFAPMIASGQISIVAQSEITALQLATAAEAQAASLTATT